MNAEDADKDDQARVDQVTLGMFPLIKSDDEEEEKRL